MKFIEMFAVVSIIFVIIALGVINASIAEDKKYAELASNPLTNEDMHTYAEEIGRTFHPKTERFSEQSQKSEENCCSVDAHISRN